LSRLQRAGVALLLGLCFGIGGWYWHGRPVEVAGALAAGERLQCASWTPFQGSETPMDFHVDRARLERDFALLAPQVSCVRIYSMKGMDLVPEVAREHDLELIAGAWINREPLDSAREVAQLIAMANRYPDVVRAVLVGNEVLLRREGTAQQLAAYIAEVKAAIVQPVSYGDVWEFWLHNRELAESVDFITIHLLPYWENDPTGIDDAIDAVARAHDIVSRTFPGKEVLVGETGWPSEGRRREDAQPSRVNEARFVRGFIRRAQAEGWHYNLIEAFDQPWKRVQEGAVGGYWGLFDGARNDKNILRGTVVEFPRWRECLLAGLALWAALMLAARTLDPLALLAGAGAANLAVLQLARLWTHARSPSEGAWIVVLALASPCAAWLFARARSARRTPFWQDAALLAIAALAAVEMLELAFDPRYRHVPVAAFVVPALVLARLGLADPRWRERGRGLAMLFVLCTPAVLWQESARNLETLGWIAVCAGLAAGLVRDGAQRVLRSAPESASASSAITAAGAPRRTL
jgi:exo-beta-1,3-glucanase (GH17 family)/uncharacterized membrane protein YhaH (DUF805 family)